MPLTQSTVAIAFGAIGALVLVLAHYEMRNSEIGKVYLISARAKHVIGLLFIIIGALIFAAELIVRR
jgi:TRAP-type mannitol/chloroaromatic compound transport system permease large subunit